MHAAALAGVGGALAHPAAAQTAQADPAGASGSASVDGGVSNPNVVGEVIVTATKRAESIQNVPLSISAVSGSALQDHDIHDFSRLDVLVPGVKFAQSGNDARPAIRGTRTQQVIGNADPVVSYYEDGIYRSRPGQALGIFLDVDRVEVTLGPQGTLFGRNSFGGAVNVVTREPAFGKTDAGGAVQGTNYAGVRAEGFVNLPIGDDVAVRLSGYESRRDGWVRNTANTGNDIHDDDNQLVRAEIKMRSGGFTNVFRAEYWHGGGAGPGDFGYYAPGIPINPSTGKTNGVSGVVDPVISVVAGRGGGYGGLPAGVLGDPDYRHISTNFPFERRVSQWNVSDEASFDLGFATLRGIFGYTDYSELRQGDPDYSAVVQDGAYNRVTTTTGSEELQLISKPGQPLQWVLGAYFLQDRPTDLFVFGNDRNGRISFNPADNGPGNLYIQGPFRSATDSIAFYGDGTYAVTDRLRLIGGVRWTQDKKTATIDNVPFAGYPPLNTEGPVRKTFEKFTYRGGLQFDVAKRSMLYATYSTGYLSGGFGASPSFDLATSSLTSFEPTTAEALEVGSKNSFLDGRLRANVAIYDNVYSNFLTQQLIAVGNTISTITANGGGIEAYGASAEVDYTPTPDWRLGLRAAYSHARFKDYITNNNFTEAANSANNTFQLRGLQVPLNPDFTATLLTSYDFDTGSSGIITPSATLYYTTSYRTSDQPYFFANQDAYATVDLAVRWKRDRGSRLSAEVFANNLTDEKILLRSTANSGSVIYQDFANPRIFGARVSYNY